MQGVLKKNTEEDDEEIEEVAVSPATAKDLSVDVAIEAFNTRLSRWKRCFILTSDRVWHHVSPWGGGLMFPLIPIGSLEL